MYMCFVMCVQVLCSSLSDAVIISTICQNKIKKADTVMTKCTDSIIFKNSLTTCHQGLTRNIEQEKAFHGSKSNFESFMEFNLKC